MADALGLRLLWSSPYWIANFSASNAVCDANNDGLGWIFKSPTTDAITHLGFRYGARTGTPPTYIIGLEGVVTTTGLPDGTYLGGGTPASMTFTPPADATIDGLWQWKALDNSYTPTRGQDLAITIRYSSGTVDGSNNSSFTRRNPTGVAHSNPYSLTLTAGTWAASNEQPVFGIRTASNRYGNIIQAAYTTRTASTVGHRAALKFTLPADWASTFKVRGVRFYGSIASAAGKTPILGLWDASSAIQTASIDTDISASATGTNVINELYFDEASLTALNFGGTYYAGLEVADAASGGVIVTGATLSEANDLLSFPGGTAVHLATYDGATWSDVQTARPMMELIFDDLTEPAGGSGGGLRLAGHGGLAA